MSNTNEANVAWWNSLTETQRQEIINRSNEENKASIANRNKG